MEARQKQVAVAGFIIGLVLGLALVAFVGGGYFLALGHDRTGRSVARRQYVIPGQPGAPVQNVPVHRVSTTLTEGNLLIYEPFDAGTVDPGGNAARAPELVAGRYGEAAHLNIEAPLVYRVSGTEFLRAATITGWVRIDNHQDRSIIWAYSRRYPSAFIIRTISISWACIF